MAAASSGSRFDILPMASGECLRLEVRRPFVRARAPASDGFLARARRAGGLRCACPRRSPCCRSRGGWLLYLGYELASEIEPRLRLPRSPDPVVALAIRAPAAWIRDRATGQAWLMAETGYESLLDEFAAAGAEAAHGAGRRTDAAFLRRRGRPGDFLDAVRRALEYIAAGDVYQTNLSRGWLGRATPPVDPVCDLPAPAGHQSQSVRGAAASRGFCIAEFLARAAGVDSREHRLDPPDRRHPTARRHAGGRRGADPIAARQREGARRTRDVDRSGAQ